MRAHLTATGLTVALLSAVVPAAASEAPLATGLEANKELVQRMVDAVNQRDWDTLRDVLAPDLQRHSGATPGLVVESAEQFIGFLEQDLESVPDSHLELDLVLAEGDLVAVRAFYRGTQEGPWGPFPPSGRRLDLPYLSILRIEAGRIAEIWVEWDNLYALAQLGYWPPEEDDASVGSPEDSPPDSQ